VRKRLSSFSEDKLVQNQTAFCAQLPPATRSTYAISFSADRKYAAASTGDHNIHIIQVNDGKLIKTLSGHTRTCWSVVFHPTNPNLLASGDLSAEVRVWDISDPNNGYESWQHEVNGSNPHSKISISLTFHPFDNVLLIAVQNELRIWDWSQKDPLRPHLPSAPFVTIKTNSEREKISYIRLSPLGDQLITAIQQNPDANEDQLVGALSTESQAESTSPSLSISRNRRSIFSGSSYPHPRNSDVLPRFSIRNHFHPHLPSEDLLVDPVAPNPPTSPLQLQRPTNEEILQAQTNPSGPLEDFLRKRRRHYENRNEGSFPPNLPETASVPSTSNHPPRPFHRRNLIQEDSRDQTTSEAGGHSSRPSANRFSRRHYLNQRDSLLLNRLSRRADGSMLSEMRRSRMRDDKKLCRLQVWDFSPEKLPEISLPDLGLLCRRVKLNNDSSCSISIDFSKIFCIVQPNENRNQLQLTLVSLKKETLGQILWIKDCTSDYLSCSLSPLGDYIAVGMKVRSAPPTSETRLIEFFKTSEENQSNPAGILLANNNQSNQFVINAIAFMPCPGQGLMYGTSTGELKIVIPAGSSRNCPRLRSQDVFRNPTVHLERIRHPARFIAGNDVPRAGTATSSGRPLSRRHPLAFSRHYVAAANTLRQSASHAHRVQRQQRQQREQQWNDLRRHLNLPTGNGSEIYWNSNRHGNRVEVSLEPEAAPTENFTEPEAMMLENINEFNNQLSHWRQRLTIPNTDQIQVIRDRLDQTVSMVEHLRDQLEGHLSSTQEIAERWGLNGQTPSSSSTPQSSSVPQPVLGPSANVPSLPTRGSTNYQSRLSRLRSLTLARPPRMRSGSGSAQASADIQSWLSAVENTRIESGRDSFIRNRFEPEEQPQHIEDNLIDTTPEAPEES